jgi:Tfp pilus assembly protein PilN
MSRTSVESVESLATGRAPLPRVNLLPPEVHEARKARRVQLGLGVAVAAVVLVLGGVYFTQAKAASSAKDDLASATAQGDTLQAQKAQYADVPRTLSAIDAAETARQVALSNDVLWYRYLNDLSYITPKNAWLDSVQIALSQSSTTIGANPVAHPGVATISVTGAAKQHTDVAKWLDAASKETAWVDAYFTDSEKTDMNGTTFVKFSSTANVTADALSHRYDRKAG